MSNPSSAHKPRKKRNPPTTLASTPTTGELVTLDEQTRAVKPNFPLVAFLWPSRGTTSQWILLPVILMITGLFKWAVGFWGYSGQGKPPMYGDFEAQRHWMEITNSLPISLWYFYDLPYWGLDYPPLTAYHSWVCGKIGTLINPSWFALDSSRGTEDYLLKVYMRATVLLSEYLTYVPALIIFLRHYGRSQGTGATSSAVALVAILMQPATMIIDHGHFQYNTVMLGFVVASLSSIYAGRLLWACIFFVAALGFKQMALYYSPVIFAFLLGSCLTPRIRLARLISIAFVTAIAFAALYVPLLLGAVFDLPQSVHLPVRPLPPLLISLNVKLDPKSASGAIALQLAQSIHRIFPFDRGLFEDKVANFWCFTNTFYKLRNLDGIIALPRLATFCTFMSILPSALIMGAVPRKSLLPYALASSAWGFFLFSFQVHEKSVLLPLLPMTLLLGGKHGLSREYRAWIGWANSLAMWTMYPLLKRDELKTPYTVLTLLWVYLLGLPPTSVAVYFNGTWNEPGKPLAPDDMHAPTKILHWVYLIIMSFWHLFNAYAEPPADKPDLWAVVNACFGAVGFGVCYLWCTWKLILGTGLLDDYFQHQSVEATISKGAEEKKTQ